MAQTVKHLSTMWGTQVRSLGREDPLEKEMATHSSTIAWKIPWTEEPGRLQSMGSQRVGQGTVFLPSMQMSLVLSEFAKQFRCCCLVAKSCPTLCDPTDCRLSGSSVHGILSQDKYSFLKKTFYFVLHYSQLTML